MEIVMKEFCKETERRRELVLVFLKRLAKIEFKRIRKKQVVYGLSNRILVNWSEPLLQLLAWSIQFDNNRRVTDLIINCMRCCGK
jgi:hypothetical protein